jgi:hypothetical protein
MSTSKILPASLVVLSAGALLSLSASVAESVAYECRAKPGAAAPQGTHWRYRVSRPDHRHCWFLNYETVKVRSHTHEAASDSAASSAAAEGDGLTEAGEIPKRDASVQPISLRASAAKASTETVTAGPPAAEGEAVALFSARWPNHTKLGDFDAREFAATPSSYAERYSATSADEQMPLVWPVTEARSRPALDIASEPTWRATFLIGMLLATLLAIAGGALALARRLRQSRSLDPRRVPDEVPVQRQAGEVPVQRQADEVRVPRQAYKELGNRNSDTEAQQGRHGSRPITPTDPARDLKKSLAELMEDLRRARRSQDAPRSFAPRTLVGNWQRARSARDLLPPIEDWGHTPVSKAASAEKVSTRSTPARAHALSSDLAQTILAVGPSLVPA